MNVLKSTLIILFLVFAVITNAQEVKILTQETPSQASLRGLSTVNEEVAWASGTGGTVLRTIDGGKTWEDVTVPNETKTDFRDIEAFSSTEAIIISAGSPAKIYKTTNGGKTWKLTYLNSEEKIFYDAMGFWDTQRGIAFSDAMNGHLVIITTTDGGNTWKEINYKNLPPSPEGEGGFAASGTCLTTFGESTLWIGLGSPASRVFKSEDKGNTWTVVETPMKRTKPTGGIFSLAFTTPSYGIAVGGDYEDDTNKERNAAITTDGGTTWKLLKENRPSGYRSVVVPVPGTQWWLSAGTSGVDISKNNGLDWKLLTTDGYHSMSFGSSKVGWLSGSKGQIAKIIIE